MTVARATQVVVEAASQVDPKAQTTQLVVEVLSSNDDVPAASPTQFIIVT